MNKRTIFTFRTIITLIIIAMVVVAIKILDIALTRCKEDITITTDEVNIPESLCIENIDNEYNIIGSGVEFICSHNEQIATKLSASIEDPIFENIKEDFHHDKGLVLKDIDIYQWNLFFKNIKNNHGMDKLFRNTSQERYELQLKNTDIYKYLFSFTDLSNAQEYTDNKKIKKLNTFNIDRYLIVNNEILIEQDNLVHKASKEEANSILQIEKIIKDDPKISFEYHKGYEEYRDTSGTYEEVHCYSKYYLNNIILSTSSKHIKHNHNNIEKIAIYNHKHEEEIRLNNTPKNIDDVLILNSDIIFNYNL